MKQLSPVGLVQMLTGVSSGGSSSGSSNGSKQLRQQQQQQHGGSSVTDKHLQLTRTDILSCRDEALNIVTVPPRIVQMLADLRAHLQVRGACGRRGGRSGRSG